jgi:hypothetical protein
VHRFPYAQLLRQQPVDRVEVVPAGQRERWDVATITLRTDVQRDRINEGVQRSGVPDCDN